MTSKPLRVAAALAAGALLLPAAAADAKGKGHGRPAWAGPPAAAPLEPSVVRGSAVEAPAESEPAPEAPAPIVEPVPMPAKAPAVPVARGRKGKGRAKPRTFVFHGRVTGVDASAGTLDVLVRKGNARGRRFRGEVITFALSGATVEAVETDGVAGITAADVLEGDAVVVQARLARAARPDGAVVAARKVVDLTDREPAPVEEPVVD